MRSVGIVPVNLLERIAEPTSRFHFDYVAYRRGEITRAALIARLPHVAMLGDSVCMGIYISSVVSTFWRTRRCAGRNWFLDTDQSPGAIQSVSKRLEKLTPFVAMEYAGVGALVDREGERQNVFRRVLGTRNFSGQVSQLLAAPRFPDLILISIGHNNVDWTWWCPPGELAQPDARLQRQARACCRNFAQQLRRLVDFARDQHHRVAIVVYGLVNFAAYFQGRAEAERRREQDRCLYPYLETTYKYLRSFRPEYRQNLTRLAEMLNSELRALVIEFNHECDSASSIQLRYSHALANADLSRAELLHAIDGWHASVEGHNVLATAAFEGLKPSLEFLRWSEVERCVPSALVK
ncbi:MAG TPA: SGNH/GDSL hydrolase family protein [Chthoniobacterales bacterium]